MGQNSAVFLPIGKSTCEKIFEPDSLPLMRGRGMAAASLGVGFWRPRLQKTSSVWVHLGRLACSESGCLEAS
jgi:hypothetical protein